MSRRNLDGVREREVEEDGRGEGVIRRSDEREKRRGSAEIKKARQRVRISAFQAVVKRMVGL